MTQARTPQPLEEATRRRIRQLRKERSWRQEDLSRWMEAWGFDWTHDTAKNVEAGTRDLTVPEFFAIVHTFGGEVAFFGQDGAAFALSPALWLEPGGLVEMLNGSAPGELLEPERWRAFEEQQQESRLAEERAADHLRVTVPELKKMARRRWGRSLSREREARLAQQLQERDAEPRSQQALRGHITRQLLSELRSTKTRRTT